MGKGIDTFNTAKARVKQIENPAAAAVDGVTSSSYFALAKGYMEARGGVGFIIAPRQTPLRGGGLAAKTIDEWGAWLAYFFKLGIKTRMMENLGYCTVPAQWPHQFDANQNPDTDYDEAKAYRKRLHEEIAKQALHAPVAGRLQSIWQDDKAKRPIWEEPKQEAKPLVFTDEEMAASLQRCLGRLP